MIAFRSSKLDFAQGPRDDFNGLGAFKCEASSLLWYTEVKIRGREWQGSPYKWDRPRTQYEPMTAEPQRLFLSLDVVRRIRVIQSTFLCHWLQRTAPLFTASRSSPTARVLPRQEANRKDRDRHEKTIGPGTDVAASRLRAGRLGTSQHSMTSKQRVTRLCLNYPCSCNKVALYQSTAHGADT